MIWRSFIMVDDDGREIHEMHLVAGIGEVVPPEIPRIRYVGRGVLVLRTDKGHQQVPLSFGIDAANLPEAFAKHQAQMEAAAKVALRDLSTPRIVLPPG